MQGPWTSSLRASFTVLKNINYSNYKYLYSLREIIHFDNWIIFSEQNPFKGTTCKCVKEKKPRMQKECI